MATKKTTKVKAAKKKTTKSKVSKAATKTTKASPQQVAAEIEKLSTATGLIKPAAPSLVPDALPPGAAAHATTVRAMAAQAIALKVDNAEASLTAQTMLSQVKSISTRWEAERKAITKPLDDAKKRVMALFKPVDEQLDQISRELKKKVLEFQESEFRRQAAERARLTAEAESKAAAGDSQGAAVAALAAVDASQPMLTTTLTAAGSTQTKRVWQFKVVDPALVPREYLVVDEAKIRNAMRSGLRDRFEDGAEVEDETLAEDVKLVAAIPGVRIFKTTQLAVSAMD